MSKRLKYIGFHSLQKPFSASNGLHFSIKSENNHYLLKKLKTKSRFVDSLLSFKLPE